MTTYEELLESSKKHAKKKGIKLNPNPKIVTAILNGLLRNEENKGAQYCPCRPVTGNKEEDRKKICPCFWHLDEIKKQGHCLCNLFVRK